MDGAVGGDDHIWPCQQVLQDVGLIDLLQDFIVMLDLIYFAQLKLALALPFLSVPCGLIFCQFSLTMLLPLLFLRFLLEIDYHLAIDDLASTVVGGGRRQGVIWQFAGITGELVLEVEVKLGEWSAGSATTFHEDFLCGLEGIFGAGFGMEGEEVVGILFQRDYLMDCINYCLRESRCANSSFIFSIFLVTNSYYNLRFSSYCDTSSLSWTAALVRLRKGYRFFSTSRMRSTSLLMSCMALILCRMVVSLKLRFSRANSDLARANSPSRRANSSLSSYTTFPDNSPILFSFWNSLCSNNSRRI